MERLPEIMEILDKMNFFQGQRAGRELWNDKPFEVQEEDLENFKRDINTIRSYIWEIVKKLKAYEDAEEQGLLLRLPCKVGDTVWEISRYLTFGECGDKADVWHRIDQQNFTLSMLGYYGKTVFLTKEEAEQALAKMKEV